MTAVAETGAIHSIMSSTMNPSFSTEEELSSVASSSLSMLDLPDQLDQTVKETFLQGFSSAVMHSASRDLTTIREAVLGPDRIKQLVDQGCSPEMIAQMIASKQELLDGFRSVEGDVRDLALGYTVVQVATQFDIASLSDDPSIDSTRLRRFQKMVQDMKNNPPTKCIEFKKIDYSKVYKYVEEEKFNGSLVGDPAWEDVQRKKGIRTWQIILGSSLDQLDRVFRQAADEVDWSASSHMDRDLLQAMPAAALISLTLRIYESAAIRLSAGPLAPGEKTGLVDAESLSRLGRDFRSDLLDFSKNLANREFKAGHFATAEVLYERALTAGSNDGSVAINRAAALLKLGRYEEAQQSCTVGLVQLDIAKKSLQNTKQTTKSSIESKGSQRSRPMLASQETLDELRWKAFVRRGRAHKGILTQLGGLSGSEEKAYIEENLQGTEEEEDERAERRGQMLMAARSDFAAALQIDPLDDIPRQEMASLTIHPLQRRRSGDASNSGLALSSIFQLDREQRLNSQATVTMPTRPRRSESS